MSPNKPVSISVSGEVIGQGHQKVTPATASFKDFLLKHKKAMIALILVLTAIAAGALLLAYFLMPRVTVVSKNEVDMPDSSRFAILTLSLTDLNLFEDSSELTVYATYALEDKLGRRLQGTASSYFIHSFHQETGINIRMTPQSNTSFFVNQGQFLGYAEKEYDKIDGGKGQNATGKTNGSIASTKEFFGQLGSIFTQAVQKSGTKNVEVKFIDKTMANIKLEGGFLSFDLSSSKRTLLDTSSRRLFLLSGLLKVATSIIPKVAGFFVETIRKHGPMIGKVVGGVVGGVGGFFVGGPMGAFQGAMTGMNIGGMIGGAASSMVNACIPQGTLRISCSPDSIGSVINQFGSTSSFSNLLPSQGAQVGGKSAGFGNFGSFGGFGGGGGFGNFGSFFRSIPSQALSNFGFGSLFPTG